MILTLKKDFFPANGHKTDVVHDVYLGIFLEKFVYKYTISFSAKLLKFW